MLMWKAIQSEAAWYSLRLEPVTLPSLSLPLEACLLTPMTSGFHGESGRAEGENEKEESRVTAVWAGVCGRNVNEHDTGCEKWGCFTQWLQMCPFITAPLLPFLWRAPVCARGPFTSPMPPQPSHLRACQHRCVCSAIDELLSLYNLSCQTCWR